MWIKKKEFQVWLVNNDLNHWKAYLKGPSDSVYEGGVFQIDIKIPEKYPYLPPKMQFDTKIWHPNMSSQTGAICLDILKDEWTPALSIRTALLSIQALLTAAEPGELKRQPPRCSCCKAVQGELWTLQANSHRMDQKLCEFRKNKEWENFKNYWNGIHSRTGDSGIDQSRLGCPRSTASNVVVKIYWQFQRIYRVPFSFDIELNQNTKWLGIRECLKGV